MKKINKILTNGLLAIVIMSLTACGGATQDAEDDEMMSLQAQIEKLQEQLSYVEQQGGDTPSDEPENSDSESTELIDNDPYGFNSIWDFQGNAASVISSFGGSIFHRQHTFIFDGYNVTVINFREKRGGTFTPPPAPVNTNGLTFSFFSGRWYITTETMTFSVHGDVIEFLDSTSTPIVVEFSSTPNTLTLGSGRLYRAHGYSANSDVFYEAIRNIRK